MSSEGEATLETLDEEKGTPPKSRIKDSHKAYSLFGQLKKEERPRARKRSVMQGMIDGNRPYDTAELERLGQSFRSNVNFREAEAYVDARKTSYYELLTYVEYAATVTVKDVELKEFTVQEPSLDYGRIITEEYDEMLKSWNDYYYSMMLHQDEMIKWGIGPVFWPDEMDWRFESVKRGCFLVPMATEASTGKLKIAIIRDSMTVDELYALIRDDDDQENEKTNAQDSSDKGWNVELIKKAIVTADKDGTSSSETYQNSMWESVQQRLREDDLTEGYVKFGQVHVAHILLKEFSGKVSHYIIRENFDENDFLFKSIDRFDGFEHTLNLFCLNIGDGTYHSIKGLAHKIYAHLENGNKMMNTIVDGAMTGSTIIMQPRAGGAKQAIHLARIGFITVLPEGFDVIQQGYTLNVEGLSKIRAMIKEDLNQNVGLFRPSLDKVPGPEKTLGEATMEVMRQGKLESSDINLYYLQWDKLHQEILRRVLSENYTDQDPGYEEASEFKRRCKERGVPEKLLKLSALKIIATRAIGNGSPLMRNMITREIVGMSPYYDERGRDNAIRDRLASLGGYQIADRYKPQTDRDTIPTTQHTLAKLENNQHKMGMETIVGVDEPHVIHITTHLNDLAPQIAAFVQGQSQMEPEQLLQYAQVAMNHIAQHLDLLRGDPAREPDFLRFMQVFQSISKYVQQLGGLVQKRAQERQRQLEEQQKAIQEAMSQEKNMEMMLRMKEIEADLQYRILKEQNMQAIREQKAQHSMALKTARTQQDIASIQQKTSAETDAITMKTMMQTQQQGGSV